MLAVWLWVQFTNAFLKEARAAFILSEIYYIYLVKYCYYLKSVI